MKLLALLTGGFNKDILEFYISMNDVLRMDISYRIKELNCKSADFGLGHSAEPLVTI